MTVPFLLTSFKRDGAGTVRIGMGFQACGAVEEVREFVVLEATVGLSKGLDVSLGRAVVEQDDVNFG